MNIIAFKKMNSVFFEVDDSTNLESQNYVKEKIKEFSETERAEMFAVILHNDPINGVEYVTKVIKEVFGYSTSKAIWLMLKAHFTGSSKLWICPLYPFFITNNYQIKSGTLHVNINKASFSTARE